jgi:hypothetical protein
LLQDARAHLHAGIGALFLPLSLLLRAHLLRLPVAHVTGNRCQPEADAKPIRDAASKGYLQISPPVLLEHYNTGSNGPSIRG